MFVSQPHLACFMLQFTVKPVLSNHTMALVKQNSGCLGQGVRLVQVNYSENIMHGGH